MGTQRLPQYPGGGGGGLQLVLMRHPPPDICQNLRGGAVGEGGGGFGGRVGGGGYWQLGQGGGPARNPLLPHAYLKGVCVCLGTWGYRGMYAIKAIPRLCREESLKGLEDQRHSTPFNFN